MDVKIGRDGFLAMLVDASDQEKAAGHEGWVALESGYEHEGGALVDAGLAEKQSCLDRTYFRPTDAGRQAIAPGRPH